MVIITHEHRDLICVLVGTGFRLGFFKSGLSMKNTNGCTTETVYDTEMSDQPNVRI